MHWVLLIVHTPIGTEVAVKPYNYKGAYEDQAVHESHPYEEVLGKVCVL